MKNTVPRQHITTVLDADAGVVAPPIYVHTPGYNFMHSGIRCLYLLCHHLGRLGYEAYLNLYSEPSSVSGFDLPILQQEIIDKHRNSGREPIVIYPEVVEGNPLGSRRVIRYLLNRPGFLFPGIEESFGADEYSIHFAEEFVPANWKSTPLYIPLVDRQIFYPPAETSTRRGYVIYASREMPDPASFPEWLTPVTWMSRTTPLAPREAAARYRESRALVTHERSVAIFEALRSGCPVICIAGERFKQIPQQDKFGGKGLVWGWNRDALGRASAETSSVRDILDEFEASMDVRLRNVIERALQFFLRNEAQTQRQ